MIRKTIARKSALTAMSLGLIVLATPALAQLPPELPYDAERGVFTFAAGIEPSLPAVVAITTLGAGAAPRAGTTGPRRFRADRASSSTRRAG